MKLWQLFKSLRAKYGNYIPADLWAFLAFIIATLIGLILFM